MSVAVDSHFQKIAQCDATLSKLTSEYISLSSLYAELTHLVESTESEVPVIESAIQQEQRLLSELSKKIKMSKAEAKSPEVAFSELQKSFVASRATLLNLTVKFSHRNQAMNDRRETLRRLEAPNESLQQFLDELNTKRLREIQSIDDISQTYPILQNVLSAKRRIFLTVSRAEHLGASSKCIELEAEISQLANKLEEHRELNQGIEDSVFIFLKKSNALFLKNSHISKELHELCEIQETLRTKMSEIAKKCDQQQEIERKLIKEIESLQSEYSKLKSHRDDLDVTLTSVIQANNDGFPDLDNDISAIQRDIRLIEVKIKAFKIKHKRKGLI